MKSDRPEQPWSNRVVGYGMEDPEQFLANPHNWRIHPHFQQDAVRDLLDEIGWVKPVIVNTQTDHVVDGHLRIHIALGTVVPQKIPVVYIDVSPDEERMLIATLDPLAALAIADKDQLNTIVDWMYSPPDRPEEPLDGVLDLIQKQNGIEPKRNAHAGRSPRMEMCVCRTCGKQHYRVPVDDSNEEEHHGNEDPGETEDTAKA